MRVRMLTAVLLLPLLWAGCGDQAAIPTAADIDVPPRLSHASAPPPSLAATSIDTLGSRALADDDPFSCSLFEDARIRFSDPGFIENGNVGMYIVLRGMPEGRKRMRLWWDYEGEPNRYTDFVLEETSFQDVLEHSYLNLTGTNDKKVRIELTTEDGGGHCVRVRNITLTSRPTNGVTTSTVGKVDNSGGGATFCIPGAVLDFTVSKQLTLNSVRIYPQAAPATVVVRLRNSGGGVVTSTSVAVTSTGQQEIPVGFQITPGDYFLDTVGSSTNLGCNTPTGASYPYAIPGVVSINDTLDTPGGTSFPTSYVHFYNWSVSFVP